MDLIRSTATPHNWLVVLIGATALGAPAVGLLPWAPLAAQQRPTIEYIIDADGAGPDLDVRTVHHAFDLFANADLAFAGMRMTGNFAVSLSNAGDCSDYRYWADCQGGHYVRSPLTSRSPYFDVEWISGAPPTDFNRIKQVAPSISNATGGGWTGGTNMSVLGGYPLRWGPHDGTLGRMFSGITTTADGSCRDATGFANGYTAVGVQLLPTSDCPETWGTDGWQGGHPIDATGYAELLRQRGDSFAFDFWRVPPENQRLDLPLLGSRFETYGETSDYTAEVLANYGSVVPGGTGVPKADGYPLGLLIHFDAFTFSSPTVNGAYFVKATIVNRSADVWGTGVDYDSLYLGFEQGTLFSTSNVSRYAVLDKGLVVYHNNNVQGAGGPCDDAYRRPEGSGCSGDTYLLRGYGASATALIFLKTPLGDLRNKLFTRTADGAPCVVGRDPFCRPGHPNAGDTLTFNHQSFGDYNSVLVMAFNNGARSVFGYIAGDETELLAGRDPASFSDRHLWRTFRSEDWPGSSTLVGSPNKAHFNKYVPPASPPWDYNHDGVPDTLALATCGRYGCAALDSDTMPGGWINRRGIIGGHQSFGPFSLKAGDTTAFIYAHVGGGDSASFWGQVDAAIDLYMNFFPAPQPPPPVDIVSTQLTPGTDALGTTSPQVGFFFSDTPAKWVDPAITKLASDVASQAGWADVYALNPWLPDSLRARASDNVEQLEIYKSCDGGLTFTADSDCQGDRTVDVDGSALGLGWQAYAVLPVDDPQRMPNAFTDTDVQDGRTYLYVIVAKSRGATFLIDTPDGPEQHEFAPSFRNALSRTLSDPNVVSIYVPVSTQAGFQPARVKVTAGVPTGTVPFVISPMDSVIGGTYRAVFGNQLVVEDGTLANTEQPVPPVVTIQRREQVATASGSVDSVIAAHRFPVHRAGAFPVAGTGLVGTPVTLGDTVWIPTTYSGLGFVVIGDDGSLFGGDAALFGSVTLTGSAATPGAAFGQSDFPGFVISAFQDSAGQFARTAEQHIRGPAALADLPDLTPADTVVPRTLVDSFMVQWQEASSSTTADAGGRYRLTWADDPFGVARGVTLNLSDPGVTEAEVQALLEGRATVDTGLTNFATAQLVGVPQVDLVPTRLPFTITNLTYDRPVDVAMVRRASNRLVLGSGTDTLSVAVPADVWLPGDTLQFLETVEEDSTTPNGLVLDAFGPVRRTRRAVTFTRAVIGCDTPRLHCNPVRQATVGATGYEPIHAGDRTEFTYYVGFQPTDSVVFDVIPPVRGSAISAVTDSALGLIRVVPNPYLVYSAYQTSPDQPRLLFTHMPPEGTLRIYTVAGQFVQQITWIPADLQGEGDLVWNLNTRFGETVASGLYVWVLTAPREPNNPMGGSATVRGKFVVIRGEAF